MHRFSERFAKNLYLIFLNHCLELVDLGHDINTSTEFFVNAISEAVKVVEKLSKPLDAMRTWFTNEPMKALFRTICTFHRYTRCETHQNELRYARARTNVYQQLRKSKRESYDSCLSRLFNILECFYKNINKVTDKAKITSNCVIKNDKK